MLTMLRRHRALVATLARREVSARYRGSMLGLVWAVLTPLLLLGVYTFVFSEVFAQRVPGGSGSRAEFALMLFAGLILFNAFAECIQRAPTLVLANVNYVKRVVFPLEVLALVSIVTALFHLAVNLIVWIGFHVVAIGVPPATILWLPVVVAPFLAMTAGVSWLLAALGVYLRDVAQLVGVATTVLMFLSPIFFPIEAMPEPYRWALYLSPVTVPIEQARDVMMWGRMPHWPTWAAYTAVSVLVAWLGFLCFQKTRRGFADVL